MFGFLVSMSNTAAEGFIFLKMSTHIKNCPNCKKDYETKVVQKVYCSVHCRQMNQKNNPYTPKDVSYIEGEVWKDVLGYEGYYLVSNKGRVCRILKNGKMELRKLIKRVIYYKVGLCVNNKVKQESVHRMVATAFVPNPNNKPVVNHIDANPLNNCAENLEWCTTAENLQHAINIGNLKLRGTHNGQSILNEEKVREIRRLYDEEKLKVSEIARIFNIRYDTTYLVVKRRNWAWLD